jgi:hypothetical protein
MTTTSWGPYVAKVNAFDADFFEWQAYTTGSSKIKFSMATAAQVNSCKICRKMLTQQQQLAGSTRVKQTKSVFFIILVIIGVCTKTKPETFALLFDEESLFRNRQLSVTRPSAVGNLTARS